MLLAKAERLEKRGSFRNSADIFKKVLLSFPGNKKAQEGLRRFAQHLVTEGVRHANQNNLQAAITSFKEAIEFENYASPFNELGNLYRAHGQTATAISVFKEGISKNSEDYLLRYNLGNLYTDVGLIDEALQSYLDSISLNPKFALGHYNCALTLRLLRKFTAALKSCDKALSLNKNMANAHYIKGCIFRFD